MNLRRRSRAATGFVQGALDELSELLDDGWRGLIWRARGDIDYRALPMRANALALMLNVMLSAALGYPFWLLAARLFEADAVGLGAGATSAMRLSAQLALLGLNAAVITMLPGVRRHSSGLMRTFFSTVLLAALVVNTAFLLTASVVLDDMAALAREPGYAAGFVLLSLLWTLSVAIDAVLLAVRRAERIVVRSAVQGVVSVAVLAAAALASSTDGVAAIMLAWSVALLLSNVLGIVQLTWHLPKLTLLPKFRRRTMKVMLSIGLPNYRLSLALLAQIWILPILVAELLGASAAAYWYAVWMFGVLVMVVPSASAQALFSQAAANRRSVDVSVRKSVTTALAIGVPVALVLIVSADLLLSIMGADYAREGAAALRLVALGVLPRTFIETYVAVRRATRDLTEPAIVAGGISFLSLAGAAFGALEFGLVGVAAFWLIAQCVGAVVAALRLSPMLTRTRAASSPALHPEPSSRLP